jgi:TolB-like protein
MKTSTRVGFFGLVLLSFVTGSLVAQVAVDRPRVLVLPVENRTGRTQNDAVARTVTETMTLTLRLLGSYELMSVGRYTSDDALGRPPEELGRLASDTGADNLVFGAVTIDAQGVLTFSVSVYDHARGRITVQAESRAQTLFDVFDASDELIADAVSGFSGVRIGFGSLRVQPEGEGEYRLYLDGTEIGANVGSVDRVLIGTRELEIRQVRGERESVIHRQTVDIEENQSHTVTFSFPVVTEEERLREEELRGAIAWRLESGVDPDGTADLIAELEELYTELAAGYDGGLEEIAFYRDRLDLARGMQSLALLELEPLAGAEFAQATEVLDRYRTPWNEVFERYRAEEGRLAGEGVDTGDHTDLAPHQFTARERRQLVEEDARRNLTTLASLASLERAALVDEEDAERVQGYTALIRRITAPQGAPYGAYDRWLEENRYADQSMARYRRVDRRRRPLWHWLVGGAGVGALGYAGYVQYSGTLEDRKDKVDSLIPRYEESTDFDEIVTLRSEIRDAERDVAALETTRNIAAGVGVTMVGTAVVARMISLTRPARVWRRYRDDAYLDRWTAAGLDYRERPREPGGAPALLVLGRGQTFNVSGMRGVLTTPQMLPAGTGAWELEHLNSRVLGARRSYEIPAREGVQILYLGVQQ